MLMILNLYMNKFRYWLLALSWLLPSYLLAAGQEGEASGFSAETDDVAAFAMAEAAASVVENEASEGIAAYAYIDTPETVVADSVPALEEFDRDIESVVFVPKKQWVTGLSVSYTQSDQNKFQFLIIENISGNSYSMKISPMLAYAVADDLVLGLKFAYQRSLTKLEDADIVIDSETNYDVDHLYKLSHNYYATAFMRNYFSIGRSKRFGFFNELQLMLGGGQSKMTTGVGKDLSGVYETNFQMNVGLAPGLAVFLNNYSAIEVNVGVLGFSYTHTKSVTDRIYEANRRSKLANFKINLFSITFGVAFYL